MVQSWGQRSKQRSHRVCSVSCVLWERRRGVDDAGSRARLQGRAGGGRCGEGREPPGQSVREREPGSSGSSSGSAGLILGVLAEWGHGQGPGLQGICTPF